MAVVLAAGIGACGPAAVHRLPEPVPHPEEVEPEEKIRYADLGTTPRAAVLLALLAGLLAGVAAWMLPEPAMLPVWVVFAGVGSWLAWVDWRTRLLPYRLTAPLHVATLVLVAAGAAVAGDWSLLWWGIAANVGVFALFWIIWFVGARVGSTFGYGDVRLSGIIGLALGPLGMDATLSGTYAGFLLGAVGGIALSWAGLVDRRSFAFGPYMVVGAVVGLAVAPLL